MIFILYLRNYLLMNVTVREYDTVRVFFFFFCFEFPLLQDLHVFSQRLTIFAVTEYIYS